MYEKYSVLFVDDEINILNSLKRGLIDEEYTCYFASSGNDALKIMGREKIAVMVTDMRMPEMDGLHLLKTVKEKWPKTVGIVLSGYAQMQQILVTINQVDIFKYITKPWKWEEFRTVLHKALDYCILQEENETYKIALQKKNEAYQNIFRSMETMMDHARKSCKILGTLGKAILEYNRKYETKEEFMDYQEFMFDSFSAVVMEEKKEYSGEKMEQTFTKLIQRRIEFCQVENKLESGMKIKFVPGMMEAALMSCITVFYSELEENGLVVIFDRLPNKCATVSLVLPLNFQTEKKEKLAVLDKKAEFLNMVLPETLDQFEMDFHILYKNEKMAVIISVLGCC